MRKNTQTIICTWWGKWRAGDVGQSNSTSAISHTNCGETNFCYTLWLINLQEKDHNVLVIERC